MLALFLNAPNFSEAKVFSNFFFAIISEMKSIDCAVQSYQQKVTVQMMKYFGFSKRAKIQFLEILAFHFFLSKWFEIFFYLKFLSSVYLYIPKYSHFYILHCLAFKLKLARRQNIYSMNKTFFFRKFQLLPSYGLSTFSHKNLIFDFCFFDLHPFSFVRLQLHSSITI